MPNRTVGKVDPSANPTPRVSPGGDECSCRGMNPLGFNTAPPALIDKFGLSFIATNLSVARDFEKGCATLNPGGRMTRTSEGPLDESGACSG